MPLRPYGEITLEQARDKGIAERTKICGDTDPLAARHAGKQLAAVAMAKAITFKERVAWVGRRPSCRRNPTRHRV